MKVQGWDCETRFFIQLLENHQAVTVVVVVTGTDRNQCSTGKPVKETQSILFPLLATVPVSNSFIRSNLTQSWMGARKNVHIFSRVKILQKVILEITCSIRKNAQIWFFSVFDLTLCDKTSIITWIIFPWTVPGCVRITAPPDTRKFPGDVISIKSS